VRAVDECGSVAYHCERSGLLTNTERDSEEGNVRWWSDQCRGKARMLYVDKETFNVLTMVGRNGSDARCSLRRPRLRTDLQRQGRLRRWSAEVLRLIFLGNVIVIFALHSRLFILSSRQFESPNRLRGHVYEVARKGVIVDSFEIRRRASVAYLARLQSAA
jgi:hypothetical protein